MPIKTQYVYTTKATVSSGFPNSYWNREKRISQAMQLYNYSSLLIQRKNHIDALAFLEQVIHEYPDVSSNISGLQFSRAVCLKALNRIEEAKKAINTELTFDPHNPQVHKLKSDIQLDLKNQTVVYEMPVSQPSVKSSKSCELCGIKLYYFERQFEKNWYICPNCNLLCYDINENESKILDKGSSLGSKLPTYQPIHRREEFFCRLFLENLKLKDILLYGIGWSPVHKNLLDSGYNAVGCDLWQPLIEQRKKDFGFGFFYHRDKLPDTKYDIISAFEVFEHFIRPVQDIHLLVNHLNEQGIIVGCTDFWHGGSLKDHPNPDKTYWAHKSHATVWSWDSMNAIAKHFNLKTFYCKTNKHHFAAKVFFIMYKGTRFDELIQGLPKIFYNVW